MNSASTWFKLAQLRVKTDQELAQIIDNSLESALHLLGSAEPQSVRAEKAYGEAVKLLPGVEDPRERRRLKNKLAQVRESLERLSTADESRVTVAYS
jgi:N12 class adenine-specific DNA methylase